jgi:outer membrane murein-binding lipoprotein Lpp
MKQFDELLKLKGKIEDLSPTLIETYENINKIIENLDCLDTEKFDQIISLIKEYNADIEKIKNDFNLLKITHSRMDACLSETRILKKKRLFKLSQNKKTFKDDIADYFEDENLPF